jgi:hypothetical protein
MWHNIYLDPFPSTLMGHIAWNIFLIGSSTTIVTYISMLLAPKMNPSLWLHFVVDSMAIGSVLKFGFEFF